MKMTLIMPVVAECTVTDCAYNLENTCNARAITIGNGVHPGCDTFFANSTHTRDFNECTGVGACKLVTCRFNREFECHADEIHVGRNKTGVSCLNYALA